jgi:outer membrane protein OmpA-like peptidoglycan-associated protein
VKHSNQSANEQPVFSKKLKLILYKETAMNRKIFQETPPQEHTETPSSGNGTAQPETKEILFLTAGLLTLVFGLGGLMMYSDEEPLPATASQEIDRVQIGKALPSPDLQSAKSETMAFSPLPAEEVATDPIIPTTGSIDEPVAEPAANPTASQALEGMDVYFALNEWTLSDEAKEAVQTRVKDRPEGWTGNFHIVGYTDPQGTDSYNRALGLKRARSVQSYLVSLGIPESEIQVETLGKDIQVCQEETPTCFEQNRRAHVAFLPSSTPQGEDIQLSMTPASLNTSTGEEPAPSTENSSTISSEVAVPLQEEIQEESLIADPPTAIELLP